jgi:hypothetical protein
MSSGNLIDVLKDHKEEIICIGAASICYNLIQYLRRRNPKQEEKPSDHSDLFPATSIRFDTSTRKISNLSFIGSL